MTSFTLLYEPSRGGWTVRDDRPGPGRGQRLAEGLTRSVAEAAAEAHARANRPMTDAEIRAEQRQLDPRLRARGW